MTMTRVPLLRRRLFSQRALRRHDDYARSSTTNSSASSSSVVSSRATAPQVQHALDGRSYLLPTMTLQRSPGTHAIATATPAEGPLLQTRARKTPIVLDLQLVSSDGSPHANPIKKHELRAEMERLNALGFIPVGITNASEDIKQLAQKLHLPYFISTRMQFSSQQQQSPQLQVTQQQPALELEPHEAADEASAAAVLEPEEVTSAAHASAEGSETPDAHVASEESAAPSTQAPMVVYSSVRSGQQIFAQNRALVVLGNVNSGAEVLADGDIYVMGALKGRALAGIGGDVSARITCQSFDAELVSIAHHFTTCDDLAALPQNGDLKLLKPTTVCVQDDQLHFQSTL